MKVETVSMKDLVSPEYNPREITDSEMEKLKRSIKEFGYCNPIVVNSYNYHIIGGNQRYEAMKELGYDEIDVSFVHITDPNREQALNIALNKISGDWDFPKLENIFEDMKLKDFDITLTGFDDFDDILTDFHENESFFELGDDEEEPEFDETIADDIKSIICPRCGYELPKQ